MEDKENLSMWILNTDLRKNWKNNFRLYSRVHLTHFLTLKGVGLGMLLIGFVCMTNVLVASVVLPSVFGVSIENASLYYDLFFFFVAYLLNSVAASQVKDADDAIYRRLNNAKYFMVVWLLFFGLCAYFDKYNPLLSSIFLSYTLTVGVMGFLFETDFNKAALTSRKEQVAQLQDLRELMRYLRIRNKKLEVLKILNGSLTNEEIKRKAMYDKLLSASQKEYDYLYGVLKTK